MESPRRDSNSGSRETSEQKSDALPTELFWPLTFAKVSCIFIYVICRQIGARNRQIGGFRRNLPNQRFFAENRQIGGAETAAHGAQRAANPAANFALLKLVFNEGRGWPLKTELDLIKTRLM